MAKISADLLGHFEKCHYKRKATVATFGASFGKIGVIFILSVHTGGGVKLKNRQIMCFKEERVTTRNGTIYC